jgi:TonB family protein
MRRAPDRERPRAGQGIEGVYTVEGTTAQVRVAHLLGDVYHLQSSEGWEGVGILEGATYRGVFRHRGAAGVPDGTMGEHTIDWTVPDNPSVQASLTRVHPDPATVRWRRSRGAEGPRAERPSPPKSPPRGDAPPPGRRSQPGEVIDTDELPEVLSRVACVPPAGAGGGTVLVEALVLEDGSVSDARVAKSVLGLDEVAVACVRQWRFKPAKSNGTPVAARVAVPIKFDAR